MDRDVLYGVSCASGLWEPVVVVPYSKGDSFAKHVLLAHMTRRAALLHAEGFARAEAKRKGRPTVRPMLPEEEVNYQ